ncbi:MAG TPA: hypothetical protein ENF23_06765 [Methanosarcinales archaeon]|nr:MAG: hypothetical protein DRO03_04845 [Methanosarcinales archaeon]HDN65972.1 hypothetical protein [Methanosarcinales archaeon]
MSTDQHTKTSIIYIEGVERRRRFIDVASRIRKPAIAPKTKRSAAGCKAVENTRMFRQCPKRLDKLATLPPNRSYLYVCNNIYDSLRIPPDSYMWFHVTI